MSSSWSWRGWVGLALVIAIFTVAARPILGHWYLNLGLIRLGQVLDAGIGQHAGDHEARIAREAEEYLRHSLARLPSSQTALRSLGLSLDAQGRDQEAREAWQRIDGLHLEFEQHAEIARRAESYEEALVWYQRAASLDPSYLFSVGLMQERLQAWSLAEEAFGSALERSEMVTIDESEVYYHLGLIYQWHSEPPRLGQAEDAYLAALAANSFDSAESKADTYYRLGELYEYKEAEPERFIAAYRQAIDIDPAHFWAHLRLGHALYRTTNDIAMARDEMELALDLWPSDPSRKWPLQYLGRFYAEQGWHGAAVAAVEEALRLDPADATTWSYLQQLRQDAVP